MASMDDLRSKITAIADAIREKTGSTDTMTMDEMAVAIQNISGKPTGYSAVLYDLFGMESTKYPYIGIQIYGIEGATDFRKTQVLFSSKVAQYDEEITFWGSSTIRYSLPSTCKTENYTMHTVEAVCEYIKANINSFVTDEISTSGSVNFNVDKDSSSYGQYEYYANFDDMGYQESCLYFIQFE